ncbi:MAG TPA: hypothetical protein VFZ00_11310 [Solirubrobacter sp.]|nr:hypothetical protein [Solirubrobacter sp.]
MSLEGVRAHTLVCEHNPLVQDLTRVRRDRDTALAEVERLGRDVIAVCANHQEEQRAHAKTSLALREARAELEDLRGRALGVEERGLRDKIRGLLKSDMPAGELRRALGELVR